MEGGVGGGGGGANTWMDVNDSMIVIRVKPERRMVFFAFLSLDAPVNAMNTVLNCYLTVLRTMFLNYIPCT